ncbi:MAG: iron-containing alcohol dehydrogenase [Spirochaetia bacterium]
MQDFVFHNPTKIIFGKDTEQNIGEEITKTGKKVLFHYGGGSIKKYGLYNRVIQSLKAANVQYVELGGVKPNPRLSMVREGIALCRKEKVDTILAVGGGSVIDSAKAIAVGVKTDTDIWDFFRKKADIKDALPIGVVLTIPAAGSETSAGAVVTNTDTKEKLDIGSEIIRPRFAIMNPKITYTLPRFHTAAGATDIMAHVMERYFTTEKEVDFSDRLCEATLRTIIRHAPYVIEHPKVYGSRAEIMWAGTIAHNDLLGMGRIEEWTSHPIEHELSGQYDVVHGAGLATVFPAWMLYVYKENMPRFIRFATEVWDIEYDPSDPEETALGGILALKNFFRKIGMPVSLEDLGVTDNRYKEMAEGATRFGPLGNVKKLEAKDIESIFKLMEK